MKPAKEWINAIALNNRGYVMNLSESDIAEIQRDAQAETKIGMDLARRIIEKVGTTGIEYAHKEAVEWLKKYYPGPF